MVVHKRKKLKRYRGSMTHGWGAKKKHRGAGNRGGVGMAGSGKRADQKKISIIKYYGHEYFGKKGFRRPQKMLREIKSINIASLEQKIPLYLSKQKIKEENGKYIINLTELGYGKLLGSGKIKTRMEVTVHTASRNAVARIEEAKGKVISERKE
ncbi:uL15 family ribosomal protein [Candidatus Woesearchaeota archaeon]|nr:uL15 family ribosomal protein [Candidatus Woesearchaeota archaeon]